MNFYLNIFIDVKLNQENNKYLLYEIITLKKYSKNGRNSKQRKS
jgi:hypothetical protein